MESTLKILASHQMPSGQFPTMMINETTSDTRTVHTIAPTYLICLILHELRKRGASHHLLDSALKKGAAFLLRMCYADPIAGPRVWHFNTFYPPDWEETAWSACLLYELGHLSRVELEPLRQLMRANETGERGVGVWLKDDYSPTNAQNNVFDPVVSLAVIQFLQRVFGEQSEPTERFLADAIASDMDSLYYPKGFRDFLFSLFYKRIGVVSLGYDDQHRLFHHGKRTDVWYASRDVWEAAELAAAA
jgi:hypothetical protein